MDAGPADVLAEGDAYERYMGRWSRRAAEVFVVRLGVPAGLRWLDVGCGAGALTAVVAARCGPRAVVGLDRSPGFLRTARAAPAPARFAVADASALPVRDASFDTVVSGPALNFLEPPATAVAEAARVVRPGGLVAAYVWDYAGGMALLSHFWNAAAAVDPAAAALDEGRRFPLCRPGPLHALWAGAGLADVTAAPVEVPTVFGRFEDVWEPFLSGQGPAPGYVAALAPTARDRLRTRLAATLPTGPDGSVSLTARAWTVRGRRP
ncbi:class I SAM-dependent methyltransferase [Streptomyces virginiae]|uniref:class I SAM-dependent methyltransferase n=1 Tax=Streptomyces virginiae TaxID=1961 RepID=UPI0036FEA22A